MLRTCRFLDSYGVTSYRGKLTNNHMDTNIQLPHILSNVSSSNASMTLGRHEVAQSNNDLLDLLGQFPGGCQNQGLTFAHGCVDLLQNTDGERGRFAGSRLCLGDHVVSLDAWNDGALLDGRRLLETVRVNAAKKLLFQAHVVKVHHNFFPVGLDDAVGVHAGWPIVCGRLLLLLLFFFGKRPGFTVLIPIFISASQNTKIIPQFRILRTTAYFSI